MKFHAFLVVCLSELGRSSGISLREATLSTVVCMSVLGRSNSISLREAARSMVKVSIKNTICEDINDSWWSTRKKMDNDPAVNIQTDICAVFDDNVDACNHKNSSDRQPFVDNGNITKDQFNTPCTIAGAGSKNCLGNPCNQLNDKTCTLTLTGGKCTWYTNNQVDIINKYYEENNINNSIPGNGCYRNPCDASGLGKISSSECETRQNGLLECTYCSEYNKMGCQATVLDTKAECVSINSGSVPNASIFQKVGDTDCQCSTEAALCYMTIYPDSNTNTINSAYEPRHPQSITR